MPGQSSLLTQAQLIQLREQLAPAVQASKLLVIDKKLLTDHEIFEQLCPVLSVAHIRRILTNYLPDGLSPDPIPSTIAHTLELLERKEREKGGVTQSFEFDVTLVRNLSLSFLSVP
jgi:DIL domain